MEAYDHKKIEKKWQKKWAESHAFRADDSSSKDKLYILDMFPYPSGEGLHMGHTVSYTPTDIYSRFKRMQGFEVLHPIGWDAFGLPAENFAIKTKVHPRVTTEKAISNFRRQIQSLGFSYDWEREIGTHTPEYYRWTQWFFLLLYKNGLAYRAMARVNWCESCKTVLANEQVIDGRCERCKNEVIQRELKQWFFKITDFADVLIDDLELVDWPESTKLAQRNWIGRSAGAILEFPIADPPAGKEDPQLSIEVFTTRADTLFGATYLVLAPEHHLLRMRKFQTSLSNWDDVEKYIEKTKHKTDLDRLTEGKEKTGVRLEGVMAVNPGTKEEIPIFVADYVLSTYGTGAIMAVPAHDERDFEFAEQFRLPVVEVISGPATPGKPYTGPGVLINSATFDGMSSEEAKKKITQAIGGKSRTIYRLRDWLVSRQRYWGAPIPIIYCETCGEVPVPEKDLPVLLPDDVDFMPTGASPLERSKSFHSVLCPTCGKRARRESDTLDTFVCSSWYFFRFTDPRNEKEFAGKAKIEKWLPVDLYVGGAEHTVLHLMYARFFTKVLQKLNYINFQEPFSKLRHQGLILAEDGRKMSKSLGNVVNPDEMVERFGADALRLYVMFLGPLSDAKPWNTNGIVGVYRFLERVWKASERLGEHAAAGSSTLMHQTIKKVSDDLEALNVNTAVSQLMICARSMSSSETVSRSDFRTFLILLAPFAPHIAEELWERLGEKSSIFEATWPRFDPSKLIGEIITIVVQVDGKMRGSVECSRQMSAEEIRATALKLPGVVKALAGEPPKKIIYIPHKLLNFVTS